MSENSILEAVSQLPTSAVIVFVWNFLEAKFPKLAALGPRLKRTMTWLLAAATAIGIHTPFSSSSSGEMITIAIPTLPVLMSAAWHWIRSVAFQEWVHRSTKP